MTSYGHVQRMVQKRASKMFNDVRLEEEEERQDLEIRESRK